MIENLKKAWQGEGPEFQPIAPPRRRRREHFGPILKTALVTILALILLRVLFDLSPSIGNGWRLRALERQLTGTDEARWDEAASELSLLGKEASPILLRATGDKRVEVRELALGALVKAHADEGELLTALMTALDDPEPRMRVLAIQSLGRLVPSMSSRDPKKNDEVVAATLVRLQSALNDPDVEVRAESAKALARFGPRAAGAIGSLTAMLKELDPAVREASARALLTIDPARNDQAIAVLAGSLADSAPEPDGWPTLNLLLEHRPEVDAVLIPTLAKLLGEGDAYVQLHVLRALKKIGPDASSALPALRDYLEGPRSRAQDVVFQNQRSPMNPQNPYIADCLHFEAAEAVMAIEQEIKPWVIPHLLRIVADPNEPPSVRRDAAREVKKADPNALAKILPKMIDQLLDEKNPQIRRQGFEMLMEIDPKAIKKAIAGEPIPKS